MYAAEQLHAVRIATKKLRYALELIADARLAPRPSAGQYAQARPGHPRASCTTCRSSSSTWPRCRRCRRRAGERTTAGSKVIAGSLADECRHLHGRYIKQVPALIQLLETCTEAVLPQLARRVRRRPLKITLAQPARSRAREARLTPWLPLELYLIRHGIAAERGPEWPDDSKRPLTGKGITALKQEAKALAALGISFDLIITQPVDAGPARPPNVFAEHLPGKPAVELSDSLTPAGTPAAVIQEMARHSRKARIALVGHEPNIGELAARLIGARSPIEFKKGRSAASTSTCCRRSRSACCGGSCRRGFSSTRADRSGLPTEARFGRDAHLREDASVGNLRTGS